MPGPRRSRCRDASAALTAAILLALATEARAQQQFAELGKRHLPLDSGITQAVVLGDLDGSGRASMIVGNRGQNSLYHNDGSGVFIDVTASRLPVDGDDTRALALGDLDGDGDLDLIVGNDSGQNRLHLNNGSGTFTDATAPRLPVDADRTHSLALGDVDGDGDLDLVVGNLDQQNRLFLNDGTGTFTTASASNLPAIGDRTFSLALADLDGDGDLDLVVGNHHQQNRLYLNNGTGTFADATTSRLPTLSDPTFSLVVGDVDGDGDLDLIFGNGDQNLLYLNNGSGTFADATAARFPADTDTTLSLALGDVDGDGDLDLFIGNALFFGQQNRLYLNDGSGTFADRTDSLLPVIVDSTSALTLADIDGDDDLDLVVGNSGQNHLHLNNGTGVFSDATTSRLPVISDPTTSLALGDLDGDGDLDLVVGNGGFFGQQDRLHLNDGTGTFHDATAPRLPAIIDSTSSLALGDLDGDGDLDLVLGNSRQNRLYLNDGSGTFTDATAPRLPAIIDSTSSLALGDVDGDGDLDLVIGNHGQQNRIYINDGSGTFTDATATQMPAASDQTRSIALGDVDGDGDLDLVVGNSGQNRLHLNNGSGTFTDATAAGLPAVSDMTSSVLLGDLDGDGDLDLVVGNAQYPGLQNRLHVNDGSGTFTDATALRLPAISDSTSSLALGDVDGDGDLDLVVGNSSQQSRLYINNGAGFFADAVSRLPVLLDETKSIVLGDLDGDGDLDLVVGNSGFPSQVNRVHLNLLRQTDTPHLLRVGQDFPLDVYARYGPPRQVDIALPFLATGPAHIPLPPLGAVFLDPATMLSLPPVVLPQSTGHGRTTLRVPNDPTLAGLPIHSQVLLVQSPTANWLTNATVDVMLR